MTLSFIAKSSYGVERFYPGNETARVICEVAGMKSLLLKHVRLLAEGGFTIVDASRSITDRLNEVRP